MSHRKEKLEELIKRIVSDLILKEIKDPRIGFVTVTGVTLSSDKKYARIGISVIGDGKIEKKSMDGLRSAAGFIQHRVGKALSIRITPIVEFFLDSSIADGVEMVAFLEGLVKKDDKENSVDHEVNGDD